MEDVLQYAGKRVVVTGCASGMGAATAKILVDLGAEVIGLDVKPTDVPVVSFIQVDLKDPAQPSTPASPPSAVRSMRCSVWPAYPGRPSPTSTPCS